MQRIDVSPVDFDTVVPKLLAMTLDGPVEVRLADGVEVPPHGTYGACLKRGSLTRLTSDSLAAVAPPPDVLLRTTHVWEQGGLLKAP